MSRHVRAYASYGNSLPSRVGAGVGKTFDGRGPDMGGGSRSVQDFTRCGWSSEPGGGIAVQRNMSGSTVVTLSRPDKLNAVDLQMVHSLAFALKRDTDRQTVMNGSGRAFCAGGDLDIFLRAKQTPMDLPCPDLAFFRHLFALMHHVGTTRERRVVLVHGAAAGTGMCISALSDYRVVTEESSFSMPETVIGLIPSAGGSYFLPRLPNSSLGVYLGLIGKNITSIEAIAIGLATHKTTSDAIPKILSAAPSHNSPGVLADHAVPVVPLDPSMWGEVGGPTLAHANAIERCFSHASIDAIIESLKSEAGGGGAHAAWAGQQLEALAARPPVCLAVSLESLMRGKKSGDLGECLQAELRATRRLLAGRDFGEAVACRFGSRKGQTPSFDPAPSIDQVMEHFEPMPADDDLDIVTPS